MNHHIYRETLRTSSTTMIPEHPFIGAIFSRKELYKKRKRNACDEEPTDEVPKISVFDDKAWDKWDAVSEAVK